MVEFENPANLRQSNIKDLKRSNLMGGESHPAHRLGISGTDVSLSDPDTHRGHDLRHTHRLSAVGTRLPFALTPYSATLGKLPREIPCFNGKLLGQQNF